MSKFFRDWDIFIVVIQEKNFAWFDDDIAPIVELCTNAGNMLLFAEHRIIGLLRYPILCIRSQKNAMCVAEKKKKLMNKWKRQTWHWHTSYKGLVEWVYVPIAKPQQEFGNAESLYLLVNINSWLKQ